MTIAIGQPDTTETALILFDGECGLCNRSVRFIIDHDPHGHFNFAPLQSPLAMRILSEYETSPADLSSVVLIEENEIFVRSTVALRIVRHLHGPVSLLRFLIIVPRPLRDVVYNWIARNRYRWFGKSDACRIPDAGDAGRFRFE